MRENGKQSSQETGSDPAVGLKWEEIKTHVDTAMAALPDDLMAPVVLHYLEGRTQGDIGSELGLTQSAVSRRLKRGVKELRRLLAKSGVTIPVATLGVLLATKAVEAAPATLVNALGKMALAGVGSSAAVGTAAAAGTATGTVGGVGTIGGLGAMKLTAIAVAIASVIAVGSIVSFPPEAGPAEEVKATLPPVVADKSPAESEDPESLYHRIEREYLAGNYVTVEEAFEKGEYQGKPLDLDYALAVLRGRNAAARFLHYDYVEQKGWPSEQEAVKFRHLAGICTAAFEDAARKAPTQYSRAQIHCLWHSMLRYGHFDADSQLLRSCSPLVMESADPLRVERQVEQLRDELVKTMDSYVAEDEPLDDETKERFVAVCIEEFRLLATADVPDRVFEEIIRGLGDFVNMLLDEWIVSKPEEGHLTLRFHFWLALIAPRPSEQEREAIEKRVEEVARILEEQFDQVVNPEDILGFKPEIGNWLRGIYADHGHNPFFYMFRSAPLPHDWERSIQPRIERVCANHSNAAKHTLLDYKKWAAQADAAQGRRRNSQQQLLKIYKEQAEKTLRFHVNCVQSLSIYRFGYYESPTWRGVPGHLVVSTGASANRYGMYPVSISGTKPLPPYPFRRALTYAEAEARKAAQE